MSITPPERKTVHESIIRFSADGIELDSIIDRWQTRISVKFLMAGTLEGFIKSTQNSEHFPSTIREKPTNVIGIEWSEHINRAIKAELFACDLTKEKEKEREALNDLWANLIKKEFDALLDAAYFFVQQNAGKDVDQELQIEARLTKRDFIYSDKISQEYGFPKALKTIRTLLLFRMILLSRICGWESVENAQKELIQIIDAISYFNSTEIYNILNDILDKLLYKYKLKI